MTASKPDTRLPVDVHGTLSLHGSSGHPITIKADGPRVKVAASGWAELRQMGPRSLLERRRALKTAVRALEKLELTIDVVVAGRRAFGFGAGVKPTLLARLLGLTSADIGFSSIFNLLSMPNVNRRTTIR